MTPDEALEKMKEIGAGHWDLEAGHVEADRVLTELLRSLGYVALVEAWEKVEKWYA